jgi:hypothetical protein
MKIYFKDDNDRYIGCRELLDDETIPTNAITIPVTIKDGEEAFFIDGCWVISQIPIKPDPHFKSQ